MKKIIFLSLLLSTKSFAYSIGDHEAITRRAIDEINACFPRLINQYETQGLIAGNVNEDYNLINKWTYYSHFFHPEKKLQMRRYDSAHRVTQLQQHVHQQQQKDFQQSFVEQMLTDSFADLGHIIHHIQDMSSPPHVVPVMHGLFDGFESLEIKLPEFDHNCQTMSNYAPQSLEQIHRETAEKTLAIVRNHSFAYAADGEWKIGTWELYWKEAEGKVFGTYGLLGNHFGTGKFIQDGVTYVVDKNLYPRFKKQQLRLAIDQTKKAILNSLRLRLSK